MADERSMIVTGGARGLGAGIAGAAARAGYRVGVIDTEPATVDEAADDEAACSGARSAGDDRPMGVATFEASVVDEASVAEALQAFGTPDVVVNNAGIVRFGPLLDHTVDDFRAVVDVNLIGAFVVARAAARRWVAEGRPGCVINVTSMNGVAAGPNAGAYGASKAGLALLTSQMALEWGLAGIRVNAVAPGLIDAGMSSPIYADQDTRRARESKIPLGRLGTEADISDVVLFLASDDARYVHGQNLMVDGGVTGSIIAALPRPASVDQVGSTGDRSAVDR